MLRAASWAFRGLHCSSVPLSARMSSKRADGSGALAEKVAVITGSTKGIGFAIARRLAQDGAHVVVSSRKQQNVDGAVVALQGAGLSVTGTVCHVGKAEDRERLVATALEHSGGVDFLVCNAAVNPLVGSTLGASEQVWDKILNINMKAPALLLSQLLPHMEKRWRGAVILVSSISAYIPQVELGAYNVSKTALLGLTRMLALELAPKGIRVNYLVPGIIESDFSKVLHKNEAFWNNFKENHLLQRMGLPEDCAGLVSFLCSPDASYITGENIAWKHHGSGLTYGGICAKPSGQLWKLEVYNTSKIVLLGLSKSLAMELALKGIRVNCLVPGIIKVDIMQVEKTLPYLQPDFNEVYGLQWFGEHEKCAGIMSFLFCSDASYITRENIVVAGYSPKL